MCDTLTIRKFFRKTWRYADAYRCTSSFLCALVCALTLQLGRKGLDIHQAAFAVKKYRSHRRVGLPAKILQEMKLQDSRRTMETLSRTPMLSYKCIITRRWALISILGRILKKS
jgi:hypothetical protein